MFSGFREKCDMPTDLVILTLCRPMVLKASITSYCKDNFRNKQPQPKYRLLNVLNCSNSDTLDLMTANDDLR